MQAQVGRHTGRSGSASAQHELVHLPHARWSPTRATQYADQGMVGAIDRRRGRRRSCRRRPSWASASARASSAGYVLRILPERAQVAVLPRPARARPGPELEAAGSGSSSRWGRSPTRSRCAPSRSAGTSTSVIASVNGRGVVSATDAAADQPDGRQTVRHGRRQGLGCGHRDRRRLRQRHGPGPEPLLGRFRRRSRGGILRRARRNRLPSAEWPRPRLSARDPPVRRRAWAGTGW